MDNDTMIKIFNISGFDVKQGGYSRTGYHCVLLNKSSDYNQPLILLYDFYGNFKVSFSFNDVLTAIKKVNQNDQISLSHVSLEDQIWFTTSQHEYFRLDFKNFTLL